MNFITKKIADNTFLRNVLTLAGGAAVAQAIPIFISPVISRMYDVEDFGVLATYMSMVSVVGIIATGRYELAVMLPKEDRDAANIIALSLLISVFVSFGSLLVFLTANMKIAILLGDARVSMWLYFVPLSVLMEGICQSFSCWANRKKRYKRLTASRVAQTAAVGALNLGFGLAGAGIGGLIACGLAGQAAQTSILVSSALKKDRQLAEHVSCKRIKRNAFLYRDFPKINSIHAFVDVMQSSGIILLISVFYGQRVLGLYSFAARLLKLPAELVGSAVGQVFYQEAADALKNDKDLRKLAIKTALNLFLPALPMFVVLFLFSPALFSIVLGEKWHDAGVYARILSPAVFMNLIVSPLSNIPILVNRQKAAFFVGVASNLIDIAAVIAGNYVGNGVIYGFCLFSCVRFVKLFLLLLWFIKLSGSRKAYE